MSPLRPLWAQRTSGKAYEITYVRLKFHTSRPESFAIYKRSRPEGPWVPFQFYSASCQKTYGRRQRQFLRPGEDEQVAFCTDEFSDISPLSGGNVAFSTLEGRPSAYNFDGSPALQEWVTVTDLLISLNRLNTFGDDIFKDPKVLQSYYYAISDFSVGGRCKCNGHASACVPDEAGQLCLCKANVTGWKCERCKEGFHSLSEGGCRPCTCDPAGSVGTCDPNTGHCTCKERVEGHLCNRCQPGWFNLQPHNPAGCTSCFCYGHSTACTAAGGYEVTHISSDFSQGLEGWAAAAPGTGDLPLRWAAGEIITERHGEEPVDFIAPEKFLQDQRLSYGQLLSVLLGVEGNGMGKETGMPLLRVQLVLEGEGMEITMSSSESQLQHGKQAVTFRLHEAEEGVEPLLSAFSFQRLLSNLTALHLRVSHGPVPGRLSLSQVQLTSAHPGLGLQAGWVEECTCPPGYAGQFCQSCAPGFKREIPFGNPFSSCVPCTCNQHGDCHPLTGHCQCLHNTEGPSCERCSPGFYGNPFTGHFDDCKPCPCPGHSPCTEMPGSGEVVCTHCPPGQRGKRCELCDDGFFGDPLGQRGPVRPCVPCQCHGNVDPNAVGNCDPVSGRCLRCLYNTTGEHCERCQPGFYGDAMAHDLAGKCAACDCNPDGSAPGLDGCDPSTGQCHCLPHLRGRACGLCQPGYYNLQPAVGCKSCQCHPTGSRESVCDAVTGQCSCQPGVTGKQCDRCQHGFFGFSARGCRACNCSPLGSLTPQCHENSTCLCHPGFMGYKCDRCQANFFLDPPSSRCQQCPACYGLVKDEAERLKTRLQEMEEWLQKPGCDAHLGQSTMLGDAPRGDGLPSPHLLQGARAALLVQVGQLAGALATAQGHLSNASWATGCSSHGPPKTCVLLSEIRAVLQSTQQEILDAADTLTTMEIPQEIPQQPTNWSRRALEARVLAERYEEMQRAREELEAGAAEAAAEAGRAFSAVQRANAHMAEKLLQVAAPGYGEGQRAREELEAGAAEAAAEAGRAFSAVQRANAHMAEKLLQVAAPGQLQDRAGSAHSTATSAVSHGKATLANTESLLASLEGMRKALGHRKGQAALSRRMTHVRERAMMEAQRRIKQAEKTLGNSLSISATARRMAGEAEQVSGESAKRAQAVLQGSKKARKHTRQLTTRANETQRELSRQERVAEKLREDLEEAHKVGTEVSEMAKSLQEARGSLISDIETLNDLLSSLGNLEQVPQAEEVLSAGRLQLERLRRWLRLGAPGALAGQLGLLQQEAARQRDKIQAFESDLAEIRADKKNLEDIVRSLPEGCSK
ncbi:PREDICTED: laminin subunit gamma-3 [Chaetura pelagica]|uniref:laminin subunit gamma-3 n=1 Tax=Chaetura pelagica TaxID=8897 RepID=UPI0005235FA0|nr:PREDICTED: laminin subunit gamma-3 [Chaetura pelagica]